MSGELLNTAQTQAEVERQEMAVDIACVGFGPAMGGFLTTLSRALAADAEGRLQSAAMPGMPLQVICYERADDLGFGVSGVVTGANAIRESFPDLNVAEIPMAAPVCSEKLLYLLDPIGASRRSKTLRMGDATLRALGLPKMQAYELPYTPEFLNKHNGLILSLGQFNQWVGSQIMGSGLVQIWPATPVAAPLFEENKVAGVQLCDQGVDKSGAPDAGFMAGMNVRAALTVVGDGPVGPIGRTIDAKLGMPEDHAVREWAVGMKMVVELPGTCTLEPGTVLHTFGYPEPEIFGFLYVHPDRLASVGIFIPSWLANPARTSYRYLQHFVQHPYLWQYLAGGTMRSWGAKSLQESGKHGEPFLAGDGYARIGEGSGSTNILTNSGVDEAWATGVQLADSVLELLQAGKPFTRENLEATYVARRRASSVERGAAEAEHARDGFHAGLVRGLIGMALAGLTKGKLSLNHRIPTAPEQIGSLANYYAGRLTPQQIDDVAREAAANHRPVHEALMTAAGWPEIEYDGKLLVSQQDALLMGGKVQATPGFADHVIFRDVALCEHCGEKICIAMCSGQAITQGEASVPVFDREKCVHCGACLWNCRGDGHQTNIEFRAGAGGLHSAEN